MANVGLVNVSVKLEIPLSEILRLILYNSNDHNLINMTK